MRRTALALIILFAFIAAAGACSGGDPSPTVATDPRPARSDDVPTQPAPTAGEPVAVNAATIASGRELFAAGGGCGACHAIEGVTNGVLGPDLDGIASVAANRIPGYTAEQYLRESIVDSCAYTVEGTDCNLMLNVMNTITLTDADVDALVAFLLQQR